MKKLKKGSFTLEAALLMPLLLTVIMSMLYLDFFVHNRAWLTAAAYEAAVSGSMEGYKKEANIYETADIQGRMLGSQGLPGGENLSMQTNAGKNVQTVFQYPSVFLTREAEFRNISHTAKAQQKVFRSALLLSSQTPLLL